MGEELNCACHGEPMRWNKDKRYTAGGYGRCAVRERMLSRERYHSLDGLRYCRLRLLNRRAAALYRRRKRTTEGNRG